MRSPNHLHNPSTPSPPPGACLPTTAGTHAELLVYQVPGTIELDAALERVIRGRFWNHRLHTDESHRSA